MDKRYRKAAALTLTLALVLAFPLPALADDADAQFQASGETNAQFQAAAADGSGAQVTVEYANLRALLKEGNLTLKKTIADQEDNTDAYQEMWDIIKREQVNMEDRAEDMTSGNNETAAIYSSNAAMLKSSASRIYRQLESLTDEKSTKSIEKSADSYTYTAQTLMNSYNQMVQKLNSSEKSVNALEASCQAMERKGAAGFATQAEIQAERNSLEQARVSLASLREQASSLRFRLLTLLGLADRENVAVGPMPEPDLEAIAAIDFETDKRKAIGNDSKVQSERHKKAAGTTQVSLRFKQVAAAEGTAEASIQAAYDTLGADLASYWSAMESYNSALLIYQSLQRKRAAGMLSNTEYLQGEADFAEKEAAMKIASMNLVGAYEAYCWEVKGISNTL